MKTTLFALFFIVSSISFGQFTKEELRGITSNIQDNAKGIVLNFDNHSQILWCKSRLIDNGRLSVQFYFGLQKKDGQLNKTPMRIKVKYWGANWIFINEISFANLSIKDGETLTASPSMKTSNEDHDVVSGGVVETIDNICDEKIIEFIRATISNPRWIQLRTTGKSTYTDFTMTKKQVLSFEPVFKAFDMY